MRKPLRLLSLFDRTDLKPVFLLLLFFSCSPSSCTPGPSPFREQTRPLSSSGRLQGARQATRRAGRSKSMLCSSSQLMMMPLPPPAPLPPSPGRAGRSCRSGAASIPLLMGHKLPSWDGVRNRASEEKKPFRVAATTKKKKNETKNLFFLPHLRFRSRFLFSRSTS